MAPKITSILTSLLALQPLAAFAAPAPALLDSAMDMVEDGLGIFVDNPDATDYMPNSYIVMYNNTFSDDDIDVSEKAFSLEIAKRNVGKRHLDGRSLSTTLKQIRMKTMRAMTLDADDLMMSKINADEKVEWVERNVRVKAFGLVGQSNAPNGLERLSHTQTGQFGYVFDNSAGEGITAYIVDTGIMTEHEDFQGRATMGFNAVNNVDTDENGHGSHVAGTVGGATFGVAKKTNLVGVKVLDADGGGSNAGVLEGLQFVADDAERKGRAGKAVMNMSLGGARSRAVNRAVEEIAAAGVMPVVAAGNENQDAANVSPASSNVAFTVGAIDQTNDNKASFSNFGPDVDIFAPGVDVTSVGIDTRNGEDTLSGTSMASPHVAGLAAYIMSLEGLTERQAIADRLQQLGRQAQGANAVGQNSPNTIGIIANNGQPQNANGSRTN